jgi:3-oxoadipate enol-lactonase
MTLAMKSYGQRGPWLVLVHAFPMDSRMWATQTRTLTTHARLLTIDLPGFGESPVRENWSIEGIANEIGKRLPEWGITEPVIFGGLSMGGYVAQAFARVHPEKLRGLILSNTRCEPDSPEARAGRAKAIELVAAGGTKAQVEAMLPNALGVSTHTSRPEVIERFLEIGASQRTNGTLAAIVALRDRPDAEPGLGSILVPTLVIVGDEDKITPTSAAKKLVSCIPTARLAIVPGAGHMTNMEQPNVFDDVVIEFLESMSKDHT